MRWKFERENLPIYRCCFCCHVRTGTLFLGLFHMLVHVLVVAFFVVAVLRPDLIHELRDDHQMFSDQSYLNPEQANDVVPNTNTKWQMLFPSNDVKPQSDESQSDGVILKSSVYDHDMPGIKLKSIPESMSDDYSQDLFSGFGMTSRNRSRVPYMFTYSHRWTTDSKLIGLILTVASMAITACMIYGTLKGRSQYLTPFFCMQVFDLCLTGMSMFSYFSYAPDLKKWIATHEWVPYRDQLMELHNDHLMILVLMGFIVVLSIKMYLIGVVWTCYKYLKHYEMVGVQNVTATAVYDMEAPMHHVTDVEMVLPPKYEDALLMPVSTAPQTSPPPAYTAE